MSTPRKDDFSLARQKHHLHQSPFGHARESNYDLDLDAFPSSKQNGTRARHTFRTGTLAGAYRAASHASMSDDGAPLGSAPSPRNAREPFVARSPLSETSNPPEELADVYRRIEEDGMIADYVAYDDWDTAPAARSTSRFNRSSSKPRDRSRDHDAGSHDGYTFSDAGLFDGTRDYLPRSARRTTDYTRDEQRLRRVTGKDSPIFSKANGGARAALTADNLQRREQQVKEQVEQEHLVSEDDGERGPSLNLPRTWGHRAARRQDWARNVSGSSASETQEKPEDKENRFRVPFSRSKGEVTAASKLTPADPPPSSSLGRPAPRNRSALGERNANLHVEEAQGDKGEQTSGLDQTAPPSNGAPIPNTPIVVFKNSTFTKPNTTKRDSQELLRRLSRTESPKLNSVQTPEPPKVSERKIYDKTPRVTGAWIDTPVTERVTELPSDLTKGIVHSPSPPKEIEASSQQTKPTANIDFKPEEPGPEHNIKQESIPDAQPITRSRPPVIRPKLPKSGLETVIEDVKSGKEGMDLGEDTIEYLSAIMDDQTDMKEEEGEAEYEQEVSERLQQADTNDSIPVNMDRLHEKLSSLARNIKEVQNGLNSLEQHVVRDAEIVSRPISAKDGSKTLHPGGNYLIPSDGRIYAAIPLPRLWKRNPVSGRLQLTKLGWFTFVSLSWYVIECLMSEAYSHPLFSDTCDGYCLQPDAPVFPWVTVTMLWRWSHLSTLLAPFITISVAVFRLVVQLLGLWDGYVEEPSQLGLGKLVGEIRINGSSVSFPWLLPPEAKNIAPSSPPLPQEPQAPVWTPRNEAPRWEEDQPSMDDDEYL